jgi:hypothetical protein
MELDVQFPTVCELYVDGCFVETYLRLGAECRAMEMKDRIVSESSSVPFIFGPSVVTGEKARVQIPRAYNGCD